MTKKDEISPISLYAASATKNHMPVPTAPVLPLKIDRMNMMNTTTTTAKKISTIILCTFDLGNIDAFRWGVGITTHTRLEAVFEGICLLFQQVLLICRILIQLQAVPNVPASILIIAGVDDITASELAVVHSELYHTMLAGL